MTKILIAYASAKGSMPAYSASSPGGSVDSMFDSGTCHLGQVVRFGRSRARLR